jgi:hypothetical protein
LDNSTCDSESILKRLLAIGLGAINSVCIKCDDGGGGGDSAAELKFKKEFKTIAKR